MIDALSFAIAVGCVGAAAATVVLAGSGRVATARMLPTVHLIEAALLLQALLDVFALLRGHRARDTVEHLSYVVLSVGTLPVVLARTRRRSTAAAVVLGLGLLFVAVLVVRMQTTWRPAAG